MSATKNHELMKFVVLRELRQTNTRVVCSCGWVEKASSSPEAMARFEKHRDFGWRSAMR